MTWIGLNTDEGVFPKTYLKIPYYKHFLLNVIQFEVLHSNNLFLFLHLILCPTDSQNTEKIIYSILVLQMVVAHFSKQPARQ